MESCIRKQVYVLILVGIIGLVKSNWHFTGVNLALNKPTIQGPGTNRWGAKLAVDGNTNSGPNNGRSCSQTTYVYNTTAVWSVDIKDLFVLKGIRIYNRNNYRNLRERIRNFIIIGYPNETVLHDDKMSKPQLYSMDIIDVPIDNHISFSNITVAVPAHDGSSSVTLCEVQIYSVENDCSTNFTDDNLEWSIRNGTVYVSKELNFVSSGAIVDFKCKIHHTIVGSIHLVCLKNGTYNNNAPICKEIQCEAPDNITNGYYVSPIFNLYSVGAALHWNCAGGYTSNLNMTRQCLETSEWSEPEPNCLLITCTFLGDLPYVHLKFRNGSDFISGQVPSKTCIDVLCDEGFESNVTTITCTLDENWDTLPTCKQIECEGLGNLARGYYIYNDSSKETKNQNATMPYIYGTVVTAQCHLHSRLVGDKRICGQEGTWLGEEHVCVPLCEVPFLTNGHYLSQNNTNRSEYTDGESIIPQCDKGYILDDTVWRTCLADHTWNGTSGICTREVLQTGNSADQTLFIAVAAGGGTTGAVAILAVLGVVVFFVFRKRQEPTSSMKRVSVAYENAIVELNDECRNDESAVYVNVGTNETPRTAGHDSFSEPRSFPKSAIILCDLPAVVFPPDSASKRFSEEFQTFREGMTKDHNNALKNITRHKYRNMYAYDESRVVLHIWDEDTDTDYINACYIHGFKKPCAYIASQGPFPSNLNDFWRMVWQTNAAQIVMLTNLIELGQKKCIQYWPDNGSEVYGQITVTLEARDTFSNFVIRTLNVKKDGEPQRQVQQFHFTAWPDKDVPSFYSALVHFRSKVKAAATTCDVPIVVHCSAGVGRTGTYIAIDYLVDEARELGYVDVVGCVTTLREQRVDMVQKEKQYVFVHFSLVEILLLKTSVVSTSDFVESYKHLLKPANGTRQIDDDYDLLWKLSPKATQATHGNSEDPVAEQSFLQDDKYMPSYSEPGTSRYGEFIDAAFLPLYKDDNAMIIAKTPSERTIEKFWNLVYHQQVHSIVMMDQDGIYWPEENRTFTHGDITVSNNGVENKRSHSVFTLAMINNGSEREIQMLQFGRWATGNSLPDDPRHVLSALEIVDSYQKETGNHPIVVQCKDGVERSGLFCVIAALLDRTRIEQDVAISQVIQELRNRRKNIIPNVEQFEFCHDVVCNFLQQYETYSNFSLGTQIG